MCTKPTKDGKHILEFVGCDISKHALSFLSVGDISAFGSANKSSYFIVKGYYLDRVHDIAWIDEENEFHIRALSSIEKHEMNKDLWSMTTNDNEKIHGKEYLLERFVNKSFDWAMFIRKQHRGVDLNETKGYWKMLTNDYYMINDLNVIKSLVLHKEIAPMLLNYDITAGDNPFKDKIIVNIHESSDKIRKYDVSFWNGASPNQCNTFEIHDHQKDRTRFVMNFNSSPSGIYWHWYDNDSSRFKPYNLGAIVNAQIECSFQANLVYNFPLQLQKSGLFNNVNLTILKREFIEQLSDSGNHNDKVFVLRCGFDNKNDGNRKINTMEQLTITTYGFPRSIKRIKELDGKYINDFCVFKEDNFAMRMIKYNSLSKIQSRNRSKAIYKERKSE